MGVPFLGRIPIAPKSSAVGTRGIASGPSSAISGRTELRRDYFSPARGRRTLDAAMIRRLRITVLADNSVATPDMLAEHGLSILIEADDRRFLFDTGQGKVLRANAEVLGASLSSLDAVVLSHGHYDHTGGLARLLREGIPSAIFLHPAALQARYARHENPPHPDRLAFPRVAARHWMRSTIGSSGLARRPKCCRAFGVLARSRDRRRMAKARRTSSWTRTASSQTRLPTIRRSSWIPKRPGGNRGLRPLRRREHNRLGGGWHQTHSWRAMRRTTYLQRSRRRFNALLAFGGWKPKSSQTTQGSEDVRDQLKIEPIGVIETPFREAAGTPIQPSRANGARGSVRYRAALSGRA